MNDKTTPTDEEIRAFDNVPVDVAARYIGKSAISVRCGLMDKRLPFGAAIRMPGGQYSYSISPGMLIAYKTGTMPMTIINCLNDYVE